MKAVIFDMDGVIVDNSKTHRYVWEVYLQKKGLKVDKEKLDKMYGMRNEEIIKMFFGDTLSHEEAQIMGDEKEALYRDIYASSISLPEGLIEFLDAIKSKQMRTAIATSANIHNVNFTLDSLGIRKYFDVIIKDTDVEKGKPDPEVYLKAAQKLEISPKDCIVIEDAVVGVKAGKAAGCYVVAITTTHIKEDLEQADLIIDNFCDDRLNKILQLK